MEICPLITRRMSVIMLTVFTLFPLSVGYFVLEINLMGNSPDYYPLIPLYFYIFGLFDIYMLDYCRRYAPQRVPLMYLGVKMIKLIVSLLVLVVYCVVVREETKVFLLTFGAFYLIFLIYESCFFFIYESLVKRGKNNKDKNEKTE